MSLRQLSLRHVRNLETLDCELGTRFTVFSGPNGAGKTNILEAIYFLSTLRSFRVNEQSLLLRNGQDTALFAAKRLDPKTELFDTIKITLQRSERSTRKSIYLNEKHQRSAAQVYGRLPAILFTPEDLGVVRGSPSGRRQFLDRVLFAQDQHHITDIQQYDKLLRSRNRLLKLPGASSPSNHELFETYERGLSDLGARIWIRRAQIVLDLQDAFARYFAQIQGSADLGSTAQLAYHARIRPTEAHTIPDDPAETLARALQQGRPEHIARGSTRVGPHLDDLVFSMDGTKAPDIASQGQLRAMVLAFKIAELDLATHRGIEPLLLLDDVSSEFDPQRNEHLFSLITDRVQQCVVTTTDPRFLHIDSGLRRDFEVCTGRLRQPLAR